MVFDQRPDELFADVVQRGITTLKELIGGVSSAIRTGDDSIRDLDDALTGGRPKFGETPQETFSSVLEMLQGTMLEAKEKSSATASSVVQHSREILTRINAVEPGWRSPPTGISTAADMFRVALRDLRGSNSLIRLAQGTGTLQDLEGLSTWAEDLNGRVEQLKAPVSPQTAPEPVHQQPAKERVVAPKTQVKKTKKDTTPKAVPEEADIVFAQAVAAELNDEKVTGWAEEFSKGKISEAQWVSRLTNHAAATRETLDDVFERAHQRIAKESDANQK